MKARAKELLKESNAVSLEEKPNEHVRPLEQVAGWPEVQRAGHWLAGCRVKFFGIAQTWCLLTCPKVNIS